MHETLYCSPRWPFEHSERYPGGSCNFSSCHFVTLPACSVCLTALVCLQVARQEGAYLAKMLKHHNPENTSNGNGQHALPEAKKAFKYTHLGSLAYVGTDKAVMDIPKMGPITGFTAGMSHACCTPKPALKKIGMLACHKAETGHI